MAAQPTRRRFTVDEYYRMGAAGVLDEDDRVELVEGEIIQIPPIGLPHAACVDVLAFLFITRSQGAANVRVQNPLRLDDGTEPVPDVMLLKHRSDFYRGGHPSAADVLLLVEVSDTTLSYDQHVKLPLYARHAVAEVWIMDLNGEIIWTYREPARASYQITEPKRRGDTVSSVMFQGLTLAVDDILG